MTNLPPPPPPHDPSAQYPPPQYPPPPPGQWGPPSQNQWGPPPVPPPAPTGRVKIRGRIPLRLALIFGVVGVALCVIGIVVLVQSPLTKTDDFPRVPVNTRQSIRLDRSGEYVVYFETPSSASHRAYVQVQVLDPSGQPVRIGRYDNELTYDLDGRHAEALFTFRSAGAGTYQVASRSTDAAPGAQLSFGESVAHGIVGGVLTFAPGLLLVVAAVVLLIVGLVKRSRHKRELASAYVGGPGPNYFTGR